MKINRSDGAHDDFLWLRPTTGPQVSGVSAEKTHRGVLEICLGGPAGKAKTVTIVSRALDDENEGGAVGFERATFELKTHETEEITCGEPQEICIWGEKAAMKKYSNQLDQWTCIHASIMNCQGESKKPIAIANADDLFKEMMQPAPRGWTAWEPEETDPNAPENRKFQFVGENRNILQTPTTTRDAPYQFPIQNHYKTKSPYPNGFVLDVEFWFDPNQGPIFPSAVDPDPERTADRVVQNKHRPTFLGNSGISIFHWPPNRNGKYLYEVQVTNNAAMCSGNQVFPRQHDFVRLNFGEDFDQEPEHLPVAQRALDEEKTFLDPARSELLRAALLEGGADNLCAVVSGMPISYFEDKIHTEDNTENIDGRGGSVFPKATFARSSEVPINENFEHIDNLDDIGDSDPGKCSLPISGSENPREMFFARRADYVPKENELPVHYNNIDEYRLTFDRAQEWNKLRVYFFPARFENGQKQSNAYLRTMVNGTLVFQGELKTGTRTSRRTAENNPERDVYVENDGDKCLRILGHWGSTVYFRNVSIRSK